MKLLKTIALLMVLSSCAKKEVIDNVPIFNDPNWDRIEIAEGKEAHAVYGNIDDTLMVSTIYSVNQTTDKGKTWHETKVKQLVYGFLSKADTVFALRANFLKNQSNQRIASYSEYFTIDKGLIWKYADQFNVSKQRLQEFATVHPNNQITIRLIENLEPINGNPNASIVLNSDVQITKNGTTRLLDLPFNNQITNLYLDKKGRLYVSAGSAIYDKKSKKYLDYEKKQSAIVYISKQNILSLID